jgi:hypothetical protein
VKLLLLLQASEKLLYLVTAVPVLPLPVLAIQRRLLNEAYSSRIVLHILSFNSIYLFKSKISSNILFPFSLLYMALIALLSRLCFKAIKYLLFFFQHLFKQFKTALLEKF